MISSTVSELLNINYHEQRGLYRQLAGMRCSAVTGDVYVGDFLYRYIKVLDSYSVFEVVRVADDYIDAVRIDCDGELNVRRIRVYEHTATHGALHTTLLTVWRAVDPAERARIERDGFEVEPDYIACVAGYEPGKRHLLNKMFPREPPAKPVQRPKRRWWHMFIEPDPT
jgi:hypothetical protein